MDSKPTAACGICNAVCIVDFEGHVDPKNLLLDIWICEECGEELSGCDPDNWDPAAWAALAAKDLEAAKASARPKESRMRARRFDRRSRR